MRSHVLPPPLFVALSTHTVNMLQSLRLESARKRCASSSLCASHAQAQVAELKFMPSNRDAWTIDRGWGVEQSEVYAKQREETCERAWNNDECDCDCGLVNESACLTALLMTTLLLWMFVGIRC